MLCYSCKKGKLKAWKDTFVCTKCNTQIDYPQLVKTIRKNITEEFERTLYEVIFSEFREIILTEITCADPNHAKRQEIHERLLGTLRNIERVDESLKVKAKEIVDKKRKDKNYVLTGLSLSNILRVQVALFVPTIAGKL